MAWPDRSDQFRRLLRHFTGTSPVLDLGCGEGAILGILRKAGIRGEGVERSEACLKAARKAGFRVHKADVTSFIRRARPGSFGAVVASHIVEHLPPAAVPRFLSDCARVLRPGGTLLILTPNPRNIGVITRAFWGNLEHQRPYALELLRRLVESAGLKVLVARDDPYTRQHGIVHTPLRLFRRLLVGDYWPGADLLVIARK